MKDLLKLSWRNIWRNIVRSGIVISAVALGVWALIFILGFTTGMINNYISSSIRLKTSHIQIHNPKWLDDPLVKNNIDLDEKLKTLLQNTDSIASYSPRVKINGTAASAHSTRGVEILGVDIEKENMTSGIEKEISDGEKFSESEHPKPLMIGAGLMEELKLKVDSKVILNFSGGGGNIQSVAFRIQSVYSTGRKDMDEGRVYVPASVLQDLMNIDSSTYHEIAILLTEREYYSSVQHSLMKNYPSMSIRNFKEISPDLALMGDQIYLSMGIMVVIVLLALVFGILNTMLMVILERTKELGMLMAIGMNKLKVYFMIVLETLMLSLLGAPIGLLLGWLTTYYFSINGIDLSIVSEGLKEFGMSTMVYPEVELESYILVAIPLIILAILASLYPAYKAISLRPVEALRKI